MKKLVSILLALALILSLSVTAFATTVTVSDSRDFDGHKLLNLSTSLKCDHTEGQSHTTDCYNYAYTVNETYRAILQNETFDNYNPWTEGTKPESADKVTDAQILKYLESLGSDSDGEYGTLRPAADRIYRAIKNANIDAVADISNIEQGYWLFVDVSTDKDTNSLVVVDTAGQDSLTITPKTGLPTLEKKVKDTNDSTGKTTDWQDSADHDITDTVDFQLTATMPENIASYDTYAIIFHDNLSEGLTLLPGTIKVMMYANEDATTGTDVTASFNKPDTAPANGEFTISHNQNNINNVKALGATKDSIFVVTYSATLNENAVIGAAGNPNTAYLEFSNNPYDDGTGKTKDDTVIVYTYKLIINKVDENNQALKGAGFTLYKKDATGNYNPIVVGKDADGKTVTELKGADMTTFEWKGLDDGDYKLVETTVPAGYNKMKDIDFTITAEHEAETKTLNGGAMGEGDFSAGTITKDVENHTGTVLPETGAKGTVMLITISTMFVMVATVFMVTRKKMSIYED